MRYILAILVGVVVSNTIDTVKHGSFITDLKLDNSAQAIRIEALESDGATIQQNVELIGDRVFLNWKEKK